MGNRYTRTTLTARELDTLQRCRDKIMTIIDRRIRGTNEDSRPLNILIFAVDKIDRAITDIELIRRGTNP